MAKFNDKNLRLKDGEKIIFGNDLDANLWYNGDSDQLSVDVTISGVTPTQDSHLTTKQYVDSKVGSATFIGLTDTPTTYSGFENYVVRVNATGDALDFVEPGITEEGVYDLDLGISSVTISFGVTLPSTDYVLTVSLENKIDAEPSIYPTLIKDKTVTGFSVDFSGELDSDNYYLNWRAALANVPTSSVTLSDGSVTLTKMADIDSSKLIGRKTSGTGSPEALSADDVKGILGISDVTPLITTDHTWNGNFWAATAGESLVFGDVCYLKSDGKMWKCDADAEATTKGFVLMATGTIAADGSGTFLNRGFIRDDSWNWTIGAELFVPTTPGNPTETKPSGTTDVVRIVGYAYTSNILFFEASKSYIEVT